MHAMGEFDLLAKLQDRLGEAVQQVGDEVAFGVDHHHPTAGGDVVQGEVGDQGRFARPGGPQQVEVVAGVGGRQPDRSGWAQLAVPQQLAVGGQPRGWGHRAGARPD